MKSTSSFMTFTIMEDPSDRESHTQHAVCTTTRTTSAACAPRGHPISSFTSCATSAGGASRSSRAMIHVTLRVMSPPTTVCGSIQR
eukprot:3818434-Alexandrium_andersonii.AAC.1